MDCRALLFRQLPHQPKLFLEYLDHFERVKGFYAHPPTMQAVKRIAGKLEYPRERRAEVAELLRKQNVALGASAETESNLERLDKGAVAIVTGQQVGLFSGPAYAIYKALTAVQIAEELTRGGIPAVPVFWMATEDHDLEEVRHASWFGQGKLKNFELPLVAEAGRPVGGISLGAEVEPLTREAAEFLSNQGSDLLAQYLTESYRPEETYGSAFAKLFTRLFAQQGLILMDPLDPGLHRGATPLYQHALAGRDELAHLTHAEPEKFSPNALFRSVVQDFLLPTAAYVGGPAEISYFAQAEVIYRRLLGRMPVMLPRAGFTLVDAKAAKLLRRYGLTVEDVWAGSQSLRHKMEGASVPKGLSKTFERDQKQIQKMLTQLGKQIAKLDPTLKRTVERAKQRIEFHLDKLRRKAGKAQDQKTGLISAHEQYLESLFYPHKALQSRELCLLPFLARWGASGLSELQKLASGKKIGHHFIIQLP